MKIALMMLFAAIMRDQVLALRSLLDQRIQRHAVEAAEGAEHGEVEQITRQRAGAREEPARNRWRRAIARGCAK